MPLRYSPYLFRTTQQNSMHRRIILLITLALASIFLGACTLETLQQLSSQGVQTQPTEAIVIDEALYQRGVTVYLNQYCGTCHQLSAANTRGTFGPAHNAMGIHAEQRIQHENYNGTATDAESYIRESILDPQIYVAPGYETTNHHMPPYGHLPPEDIEAMVYMLLNQREAE